jgi:hypothetical protein
MPDEPEFDPIPVLVRLADAGVDFVVIGGVAAGAHGSAYATEGVDLAYSRESANLERLANLLRELDARQRGAPSDLPVQLDARSLFEGGNFTFETSLGKVDILAFPAGAPAYPELRRLARLLEIQGREIPFASLDHLIAMKEATGRPRDLVIASELRMLADEIRKG